MALSISTDNFELQTLLPNQKICSVEEIKKGCSSKKYLVTTSSSKYILRVQSNKQYNLFAFEVRVTQVAANLKISPQLFAYDNTRQQMLLEYVLCQQWPPFKENPAPYCEAMRLLRIFHHQCPDHIKHEEDGAFSPFSFIFNRWEKISGIPDLPKHFAQAIEKVHLIFKCILPWLKENATFCHGDFHKDNALYDGKRVFLIDWETTAWGDPFFDVVKFSQYLIFDGRMQLLAAYLGHEPTPAETAHFQLIDLTYLVVIFMNRISMAYSQPASEMLSREEQEKLLDNPKELPSFLSVSYADSSPKARQKGAIYALAEFLKKTNQSSSFDGLLKIQQI